MTFAAPNYPAQNVAARDFAAPNFAARHIGPSPADQERMLAVTGHSSLDALTTAALPPGLGDPAAGQPGGLRLPPALTEEEAAKGVVTHSSGNQPQHGSRVHDRPGLLRDHHAGRDPP